MDFVVRHGFTSQPRHLLAGGRREVSSPFQVPPCGKWGPPASQHAEKAQVGSQGNMLPEPVWHVAVAQAWALSPREAPNDALQLRPTQDFCCPECLGDRPTASPAPGSGPTQTHGKGKTLHKHLQKEPGSARC